MIAQRRRNAAVAAGGAEAFLCGHAGGDLRVVDREADRAAGDVDLDLIARADDGDLSARGGFRRDVADR